MLYDPKWEKEIEVAPVEQWRTDLIAAAKVMRERGLCQGAYEWGVNGPVCTIGAIRIAIQGFSGLPTKTEAAARMHAAIARVMRRVGGFVPGWNDITGRTADEVIAALEGAARE